MTIDVRDPVSGALIAQIRRADFTVPELGYRCRGAGVSPRDLSVPECPHCERIQCACTVPELQSELREYGQIITELRAELASVTLGSVRAVELQPRTLHAQPKPVESGT